MLKDSAPEKWEYEEHTRVKHELLRKYLGPWMKILGSSYRKILFFDCFAGRGEYYDEGGSIVALGSPIIALQVANDLLTYCEEKKRPPYFDRFICLGIEKDTDNFRNLQSVIKREQPKLEFGEKLEIRLKNDEFAKIVDKILEKVGTTIAPSFFFIDPFGYSGVPFKVVERIMSLPRTEIFFTLMTRDINRFLANTKVEEALRELYPLPDWRQIYQIQDWRARDRALKDLYEKCLVEVAGVKHVFSFRVSMDEKYQTLYYLIHATNRFRGLKIMKDIMYKQGASGTFAYLGPEESTYRNQMRLFKDDISSLKHYLLKNFKGKTKKFEEILEETYMYTPFVESHYKDALRKLEAENRIKIRGKGPRGGIKDSTITFPKNNPIIQISSLTVPPEFASKTIPPIKIRYKDYQLLNSMKKTLVWKVNGGSIITRFDKTPIPVRKTDVICPHFLELKWAYGCPFDCAWCYLKGTFRFRPEGPRPTFKPLEKIKSHVDAFLNEVDTPEILNTGEIADSLMGEKDDYPFSKFIISLFEKQSIHRVLFVTKSTNIKHLLEIPASRQVAMSFSLNAEAVAEKWEKKAPPVKARVEAARKLYQHGYEVRIRIDPMVPVENWEKLYTHLIDLVFNSFIPERITLGSLRGLQSTINGVKDTSWVKYLSESSNWGRKVDINVRLDMYKKLISYLSERYSYSNVALCKETKALWRILKLDYKKIKCNCVW